MKQDVLNLLNDVNILEAKDDSKIRNAYDYFYAAISKVRIDLEKIYNAIQKLNIVIIALKQGIDKPQMIFEVYICKEVLVSQV